MRHHGRVPLTSSAVPVRPTSVPAAVLFDMDGTLVDTEPYWIAAEHELVESFGHVWTHEDALGLVGRSLLDSAQILHEHGVDLEPVEIVDRLVARVGDALSRRVPWQAGARELLETLRAAGVPCALVTMSYTALAQRLVDACSPGTFAAVVTGDEVSRGKPDPEPYLEAARRLGADVTRCVAVEDSRPGITSALASGARTIGVPSVVPVPPRDGLSRVASLEQVDLDVLAAVVAGDDVDLTSTAVSLV